MIRLLSRLRIVHKLYCKIDLGLIYPDIILIYDVAFAFISYHNAFFLA